MSRGLLLYHSTYGHIEAMANAVAEGARQANAHVDTKRVPELVPDEIARRPRYKLDQLAPIAKVDDLLLTTSSVPAPGSAIALADGQFL
jgi:NAD(P)H dehydrogenase (quinone)